MKELIKDITKRSLKRNNDEVIKPLINKKADTTYVETELGKKANSSHGTHVSYSTTAPKANGTASAGSASTVARTDHVHPLQTTVSGNAGTATKLQTTRTINGTSFDGSANITTANWGTARNITIGNTKKSVNGSADVAWSLSEIGAAAASHTHSYLPLSGGNLTGTLGIGNKYDLSPAYNYSNGYLLEIGAAKASTMVAIHIIGNSYNSSSIPVSSLFQFYDYGDGGIIQASGINQGLQLGQMKVYRYNNKLYAFIGQTAGYQTLSFQIVTNKSGLNPVLKNEAMPSSGYTDLVTITPKNISLSDHTHNYAGSSSAGGAANSAIKATQDSAGQQINTTYIKGLSVSGKTITYTKGDGTTGTITTQDTNTTYSTGTSSTSGLTKLYTGTGTATDGTMTQAAINSALGGKANSSHTHSSLTGATGTTAAPSTGTGVMRYDYNVSSSNAGSLPNSNNANGILTLNTHSGNYYNQLGFSSNGNLYYRAFNNVALDTTTAWKQIAFTNSSITGNAATATTLQNARTINGTSFNGTANITTANWGTARNIYIADSTGANTGTAVSVNGSGNVTLKLPSTITATLSGNASTSTKATQDSSGQQINKTYIKGLSVSGKTITYTKGDGSTGTITTQDTNTTYSTGTSSSAGLTKLYTGTGTATDGTMTQAAINTALSGKAASSHTHSYLPLSGGKLTGSLKIGDSFDISSIKEETNTILDFTSNVTNETSFAFRANSGGILFNANVDLPALRPFMDSANTYSLGLRGAEWKELYVKGHGNVGGLSINPVNPTDGTRLMTLNTERGWFIEQGGTGSSTSLDFVSSSNDKRLRILDSTKKNYVAFHTSESGSSNYIEIQGENQLMVVTSRAVESKGASLYLRGGSQYSGLFVDSNAKVIKADGNNTWDCGSVDRRWKTVFAVNSFNTSDERYKENIEYISSPRTKSNNISYEDMYNFYKDVEFARYNYKKAKDEEDKVESEVEANNSEVQSEGQVDNGETLVDSNEELNYLEFGFIAQDLADHKVGREIVIPHEDGYMYSVGSYITTVAGALKQAINEIEMLKEEIKILKNEN